jgi:hypothetical protein
VEILHTLMGCENIERDRFRKTTGGNKIFYKRLILDMIVLKERICNILCLCFNYFHRFLYGNEFKFTFEGELDAC